MNSRLLPFETAAAAARRRLPLPSDVPDRVDVRDLFALIWRKRRIIFAATGAGLVLALAASVLMTPLYASVSKVMIESRVPQLARSQQVVQDLAVNDQAVNSVVSVITSNVLIGKAIDEIGLPALDGLDPANAPPSLMARVSGAIRSIFPSPPAGPSLMTPEEAKRQRLTAVIQKNLKVTRELQANVIDIQMALPDRVLSARIANALANEFIASQVNTRRDTAGNATRWLEQRLAETRSQVEQAEAAVDRYRAAHLLSDGGTLDGATQQLGELNNQLVIAHADRVTAEAAYNRLQEVIAKTGMTGVRDIVTSPTLDALNSQLMDLQRQDAIWAANYGPQHPERVRLAGEIKGVQDDIAREVQKIVEQKKSDMATATLRETTMRQSIAAMEQRVVELSQSNIGLGQLQRVAESARAAYNDLLSRLNETRTEQQLQSPDSLLIERATVSRLPSSPKPLLMAAVGGMLGLVLGFGVVFFQEMTSASFTRAVELERETGLPVLAALPQGEWTSPLGAWSELSRRPYGLYAERIRHLRTALLMKDGRGEARAILLASSVPDESKTTTTLALARMAALAGRKVLVVDGDLRRSTLSQTFGWTMTHDFADFIANGCSLSEAILRDERLGFDVLACARPRPDAADQLSETWLAPMIASLKQAYDLVLVDAPATLAVADALVLAQAVDESLYLVRWRSTERGYVAKGLSQFAEAGVPVSGLVLTLVDPKTGADVHAGDYDYSR